MEFHRLQLQYSRRSREQGLEFRQFNTRLEEHKFKVKESATEAIKSLQEAKPEAKKELDSSFQRRLAQMQMKLEEDAECLEREKAETEAKLQTEIAAKTEEYRLNLEELKAKLAEEIRKLESEISAYPGKLEAELKALDGDVRDLEREIRKQEKKLQRVRKTKNDLVEKCENLQNEITEVGEENGRRLELLAARKLQMEKEKWREERKARENSKEKANYEKMVPVLAAEKREMEAKIAEVFNRLDQQVFIQDTGHVTDKTHLISETQKLLTRLLEVLTLNRKI